MGIGTGGSGMIHELKILPEYFEAVTSGRKQLINYCYWNEFSGKDIDIFWAGYGAYNPEDKDLIQVEVSGNPHYLQFSNKSFLEVKNAIKKVIPKLKYTDTYPILVLVDYKQGKICYEDAI